MEWSVAVVLVVLILTGGAYLAFREWLDRPRKDRPDAIGFMTFGRPADDED